MLKIFYVIIKSSSTSNKGGTVVTELQSAHYARAIEQIQASATRDNERFLYLIRQG